LRPRSEESGVARALEEAVSGPDLQLKGEKDYIGNDGFRRIILDEEAWSQEVAVSSKGFRLRHRLGGEQRVEGVKIESNVSTFIRRN